MDRLTRDTLVNLIGQLAAHPWRDAEIDELIDPRHGIITGFQELLDELEALRKTDLGFIAPAQGIQRRTAKE